MRLKVKLFGPQAQSVGERQVSVDLPGEATCAELRRQLAAKYPHLKGLFADGRFAVNCEFTPDESTVKPDDEVAFIGPVSGG